MRGLPVVRHHRNVLGDFRIIFAVSISVTNSTTFILLARDSSRLYLDVASIGQAVKVANATKPKDTAAFSACYTWFRMEPRHGYP